MTNQEAIETVFDEFQLISSYEKSSKIAPTAPVINLIMPTLTAGISRNAEAISPPDKIYLGCFI